MSLAEDRLQAVADLELRVFFGRQRDACVLLCDKLHETRPETVR